MEDNMEYSKACSNVWYLLQSLKPRELSKIPKKLLETIYILKMDDYESSIDLEKPLEEQKLSNATIGLIAFIYNNYLGTKEEKEEYERTYKEYIDLNNSKDNYEIEFKKKNENNQKINKMEIALYSDKTNVFLRLINKIKLFFSRKN